LVAGAGEDASYLTGHWRIFQRRDTHRYSTDDVVTAWVAWRVGEVLQRSGGVPEAAPSAAAAAAAAAEPAAAAPLRCIDIGCGIGSVLLMMAWLHPTAVCRGVEAQATRAAQAARSVRLNGAADRVSVVHADLRHLAAAGEGAAYDLVTGTPPYFDVAAGALPGSEEAARCLFEYRGGIEAYCAAAAGLMRRPAGLFIVVETSLEIARTYAAATAASLRVLARVDAVPKAGKPPLFSVFVMCLPDAPWRAAALDSTPAPFTICPATFAPRGRSPYAATADDAAAAAATVAKRSRGGSTDATDGGAASPHPTGDHGDVVVRIVVRDAAGVRTPEYRALLTDMGKPA